MKKPITKKKVSITIDSKVSKYLNENINNKSKYIEYLIYKDLKDNNLMKKDIIL